MDKSENTFSKKHCRPCEDKEKRHLMADEMTTLHKEVPEWNIFDYHHLAREFTFPDFVSALAFVNKVGALAESEGHHPDIELGWGYVRIKTFTHSIDGLSENDFILASKIDTLLTN